MSPAVIQIDDNRVAIDGSSEFVSHMQRIIIEALQSAPLGGAPAKRRRKTGGKRAVAKKSAAKKGRGRKKRGRLPGRTVNGKYIRPGEPVPAGYTEVRGRIVSVKAGAKSAGKKRTAKKGAKRGAKRKAAKKGAKRKVAKKGAKKAAARGGKKRRGLVKGSKLIDGKMYSPAQIRARPELQKKLAAKKKK